MQNVKDVMVFVQTVMYSGRKDESYFDTRVRLYKAIKTKSSQSLPPDPESMQQAFRRVHYEVYYWLRFAEKSVQTISLETTVGLLTLPKVWWSLFGSRVSCCCFLIESVLFEVFKMDLYLQSHYILGEQIPSTFAAPSALSSENDETEQPAPPASKRRRKRKTKAACTAHI